LLGRLDLELDGAAILHVRGQLDREQYDTLGLINRQLAQLARGWGGDGGCGGLWAALTGALTPARPAPSAVDQLLGVADYARDRLARACRHLDGSRRLVIALAEGAAPPIVGRVIQHRITPADIVTLENLRQGLDRIAKGRTRRDYAQLG
jgi:hypothetical protein